MLRTSAEISVRKFGGRGLTCSFNLTEWISIDWNMKKVFGKVDL